MPATRPPKSSQAWYMPTSERRDLYLIRNVPAAMELFRVSLAAAGVDFDAMGSDWADALELGVKRVLSDAFDEGAKNEDNLRTANHGLKTIQRQLEALMRVHGIEPPTRADQ